MKLERWTDCLGTEPWSFLRKVSCGITGTNLDVRPGSYPMIRWGLGPEYSATISIPREYLVPRRAAFLDGSLSHETLHQLLTDPQPLKGLKWGLFVLTNCLEDVRIEMQGDLSWPGLALAVQRSTKAANEFRRRTRRIATSVDTSKLYEIGLALYLTLSGVAREIVAISVSPMALAVGEELLLIAKQTLSAPDTQAIVEIAQRIIDELEKAAAAAAKRIGTTAARTWVNSLRKEVKRAMAETVEQVYARLRQRSYPGYWQGPWFKGKGGYSFYTCEWNPTPDSCKLSSPLSNEAVLRTLTNVDPMISEVITRNRLLSGRLTPASRELVRAALGQDRRVFSNSQVQRKRLLLDVLSGIEVFLLLEAHNRYTEDEWTLLQEVGITLGRLFHLVKTPFLVRSWNMTRTKETVENPRTHRTFERWSKNHYVNISRLKEYGGPWTSEIESKISTHPRKGFNQPFEGYSRASTWNLSVPASSLSRVFVCLGNAEHINVLNGHLGQATACLRTRGRKAIYINTGHPIPAYNERGREFNVTFDALINAETAAGGLASFLYQLLLVVSKG